MPYTLPQVLVFQDFQATPTAVANPLQACIVGPHAKLLRFAQVAERATAQLGVYDPNTEQTYHFPQRPAGAIVDAAYTKLWMTGALLQYFSDNTTCARGATSRSITSSAINFAANGNTYPRDASLNTRDVRLGDIVKAVFAGGTTLWSYVTGLTATAVQSSIGASSADTNNSGNTSPAAVATRIRGPFNAVDIQSASAAAYDPYPTGQVTETYTVIVTQSSVGGDYSTAKLRILSASGLDDVDDVIPGTDGHTTNIGTHGVTAIFNEDVGSMGSFESISASDAGISPNDLLAGQRWQIAVTASYTAPTVASNAGTNTGDYTGTTDTTYVVTVTAGTKFASGVPQISVTTTTGVDISGPTNVPHTGSTVAIGTKGLTMTFTSAGLAKGFKFYVDATAATAGNVRTITLGHTIPSAVTQGTACDLTLYIEKAELEISANRIGYAPIINWTQDTTTITVNTGLIGYDPSWVDGSGVPIAMDVVSDSGHGYGVLYAEARYWLSELVNSIGSISDVATLATAVSGDDDPDNPLKWALLQALQNSNNASVLYLAVADPADSNSWNAALGKLSGGTDCYGLVPLSKDPTVQALFAAHVNDESTPTQAAWRVAWFNLSGVPTVPVVAAGSTIPGHTLATTSDGNVCLATITDAVTAGDYTAVITTNGQFVTNGVRAGDIVRYAYTGDGFGNYTYTEAVVDSVTTEDELQLLTGPGSAVTHAAKIEVWRNLTADEEALEIGRAAGAWGNRRIRAVWPDQIESAGTLMDGTFLCAALAALAGGILPHQGMTNLEITGFTDVSQTTAKFTRAQLDGMAGAGVWIVTQDPQTGNVYTRHAVTTGDTNDINQREEMVTRNVDSISFRFQETFAPYIGVSNVTPALIDKLNFDVTALVTVLQNENASANLGSQLVSANIVSLRQHATLLDRVVLMLNVVLPEPFNAFDCHLII